MALTFPYGLRCLTEGQLEYTGTMKTALNGDQYIFYIPNKHFKLHRFRAEWVPFSTVASLHQLAKYKYSVTVGGWSGVFPPNPNISATPVVPEDGFLKADVVGTALDLFNLEFDLLVNE